MRARAETDTVGEMVEDAVKDDVKDAEIVADIVWVMESTVAVAFADVVAVADAVDDAVAVAVAVADAVAAAVAVANMDDVDVIVDDTVGDLLCVVEIELVTDLDCVDVILVVADFVGSTNEIFEDDADTDGVNVGVSEIVPADAVADAVAVAVAVATDGVDVNVVDTVSELLSVVEIELVTDIDCDDVLQAVADFVGSTNEMFEDDADRDGVNVVDSDTVTDGVAVEAFEGDAEIDGENVVVGELDLCGEFVDIGDDVSSTNETLVDDDDIEYVDVIVGELEPDTVSDPDDEVE